MHRSHWSFQYGLGVQVGVVLQFKLWHGLIWPANGRALSGAARGNAQRSQPVTMYWDRAVLSLATQLEVGCLVVASSFKLGVKLRTRPLRLAVTGSPPGPGRRTVSGNLRLTQFWITHHSCQSRTSISVKLTAQALIIEAQLHTTPLRIE
jgi:hypothetical protein